MIAIMMLAIALADDFDRFQGQVIADAVESPLAEGRESLTFAQIGGLPLVLRNARKSVVVVKTDQGNLARLVLAPAYRKSQGGGEPLPILLVERLATMEAGPFTRRLAQGRDVVLFDGFRLDLDTGQVVPEGQGGDLQFLATGQAGPHLQVVGGARLFTFTGSPLPQADGVALSSGRGVQVSDFRGRFRLFANGQSSGTLELATNDDGEVTGRMFSDQTGNSYKVVGQVGEGGANRIQFRVDLPRTRQEFEGVLFTEGKAAISGSYTMQERTFGFIAIREGANLGVEEPMAVVADDQPGKLQIDLRGDEVRVDGNPMQKHVGDVVREAVQRDPATWVLLRADPGQPFSQVFQALNAIRDAGPVRVKLVPLPQP